jgi:hypothetical protein
MDDPGAPRERLPGALDLPLVIDDRAEPVEGPVDGADDVGVVLAGVAERGLHAQRLGFIRVEFLRRGQFEFERRFLVGARERRQRENREQSERAHRRCLSTEMGVRREQDAARERR